MSSHKWQVFWRHLRNQTCHTCAYLDVFWSSGDGQISKRHTFCRHPQSPYFNRPIPSETWCSFYTPSDSTL